MAPPLGTKYVTIKDKTFGKKLAAARIKAGQSVMGLCRAYGFSPCTISNLEIGKSRAIAQHAVPNLRRMCTKLKMTAPEMELGRPISPTRYMAPKPATRKIR